MKRLTLKIELRVQRRGRDKLVTRDGGFDLLSQTQSAGHASTSAQSGDCR